jgi:serine/threonine protein kinase
MAGRPSLISRIKELETLEAIAADPEFKDVLRNVYPLTGKAGKERRTKATLGEGSFGRVNLEELNEGNVAVKYFLEPEETIHGNIAEVAALKYIQGLPNVAQLIHVDPRPASLAINAIAPSIAENLPFPAIVMGKAIGTLSDMSLYKSWDDIFSTLQSVLRGYYVLHLNGIVHRDTKPQNMLMTATREVWISDFGESRYLDNHLPVTRDRYTGTYWYASPEILLNNTLYHGDDNYFKSDTWAVGASLLHILCGESFFTGWDPHNVLYSIFFKLGIPDASDGITHTLYEMYKVEKPFQNSLEYGPKNPTAIYDHILANAVYRPDDPLVLENIANIISAMLRIDPAKRITVGQALLAPVMKSNIMGIPVRPRILDSYMGEVTLSNDILLVNIDSIFEWIHTIVSDPARAFRQDSRRVILDRSACYLYQFLKYYKDTPFVTNKNLQLIGFTSLFIASSLFGPMPLKILEPDDLIGLSEEVVTKQQVLDCINMFMLADIKFYGRTFYDTLVNMVVYTPAEIDAIALLNYICYQKNLFGLYAGNPAPLSRKIIQYAKGRLEVREYLRPPIFPLMSGEKTNKVITDFIEFVKEAEGGKRTTRKTNTRKTNKTKASKKKRRKTRTSKNL